VFHGPGSHQHGHLDARDAVPAGPMEGARQPQPVEVPQCSINVGRMTGA